MSAGIREESVTSLWLHEYKIINMNLHGKIGKKSKRCQGFKFPSQVPSKEPETSMATVKDCLLLLIEGLQILKTKSKI